MNPYESGPVWSPNGYPEKGSTGPSDMPRFTRMETLADNIAAIKRRVHQACLKAGRLPETVRILPVTKGQPASLLEEATRFGFLDFGENYAQELKSKKAAISHCPQAGFVFIGRIQSNKIPLILQNAREIQSLASLDHADILARHVGKLALGPYPVWLLVNSGQEATKDGFSVETIPEVSKKIKEAYPNLQLKGIMTIPPPFISQDKDAREPPPLYRHLRILANGVGDGLLSLGMSDDLEQAIMAGSDCLRIGSALFGARLPKPT